MVLYTINHRCFPEGHRPLFFLLPEYFFKAVRFGDYGRLCIPRRGKKINICFKSWPRICLKNLKCEGSGHSNEMAQLRS